MTIRVVGGAGPSGESDSKAIFGVAAVEPPEREGHLRPRLPSDVSEDVFYRVIVWNEMRAGRREGKSREGRAGEERA